LSVLTVALAQADSRRGLEHRLWEIFAYAARYGKQPLSELRAMTLDDLVRFVNEVSQIVKDEQRPSEV